MELARVAVTALFQTLAACHQAQQRQHAVKSGGTPAASTALSQQLLSAIAWYVDLHRFGFPPVIGFSQWACVTRCCSDLHIVTGPSGGTVSRTVQVACQALTPAIAADAVTDRSLLFHPDTVANWVAKATPVSLPPATAEAFVALSSSFSASTTGQLTPHQQSQAARSKRKKQRAKGKSAKTKAATGLCALYTHLYKV